MNTKMRKIITTALVLSLVAIGAGCQTAQRPMRNGTTTPGTPTDPYTPEAPGTDLGRLGTPNDMNGVDITGRNDINDYPNYGNNMYGNDMTDSVGRDDVPRAQGNYTGLNTNANTTAQNIANQLSAMDNVEDATVVISGNTALVGVDIKDNYNNHEQLKSNMVQKVKSMAPNVTNVAITESPDLYERITNLSRDMRNGTVMQGLSNEFTEIVNRITPTTR
ncbi:YhcN/YlaJ family sporulation lipoprotein [Petroclostridium sp. X23]|uniref:YhcN/YlaJ family sporulation lipoprotein n=1 Tax=Petroclostridium sp. X23 TaxID=3045146 RepID=UPI0024AE1F9F|nr:YhcN/YlaJ family sporulation lipoprotein [Petroclostridium sp. X23]WHH58879.1 YhcN/YlaJ family sporulation lipoprotein [Petroclostridium sp. X23]